MDLHVFARVIARFKYLVGGGLVIALLLSAMTVVKLPSFAPRTPLKYATSEGLLITQTGFPWGSAVQQYSKSGGGPVPAGDMGRLTGLANLYVQLANSDLLKRLVAAKGAHGKITATQNYSFSPSFYSTALPIITLMGTSSSPDRAIQVTRAGVEALSGYLKRQQQAAGIADSKRVLIQVIQQPKPPVVVNGPKKTLPIVVFFTVMLAVIGLAFVLENVRPRIPDTVVAQVQAQPLLDDARRSA